MRRPQTIQIVEMEIVSVDAQGIFAAPLDSPTDITAFWHRVKPLSSFPVGEGGGGMHANPTVGDKCTVMIVNMGNQAQAYILGYQTLKDVSTRGYGGAARKDHMLEGDVYWLSKVGMSIWMSVTGAIHIMADAWSRVSFSMVNQEVRGWFRNAHILMKGGKISWTSNRVTKASLYERVINDKEESSADYDADTPFPFVPVTSGTIYANKQIERIGFIGSGLPFKRTEIRGGATLAGELPPSVQVENVLTPGGAEYEHTFSGIMGFSAIKVFESESLVKILAQNNGFSCDINITAAGIRIQHTGDTTIAASGNVFIGGEGNEQPLATREFVESIHKMHTHMDSNGGITGQPLNNAEIFDPVERDVANHFTYTTKVE